MPTVSPKIDSMSPRAPKVEVVKGAVIRLTCTASGKPTPIITWSRKVGLKRSYSIFCIWLTIITGGKWVIYEISLLLLFPIRIMLCRTGNRILPAACWRWCTPIDRQSVTIGARQLMASSSQTPGTYSLMFYVSIISHFTTTHIYN